MSNIATLCTHITVVGLAILASDDLLIDGSYPPLISGYDDHTQ